MKPLNKYDLFFIAFLWIAAIFGVVFSTNAINKKLLYQNPVPKEETCIYEEEYTLDYITDTNILIYDIKSQAIKASNLYIECKESLERCLEQPEPICRCEDNE